MKLSEVIAVVLSQTMKQTNYQHSEEKVAMLIKPAVIKKYHYEKVRNRSVQSIGIILKYLTNVFEDVPQYSILYFKVKNIRSIFDQYLLEKDDTTISRIHFLESELRDIKNLYDEIQKINADVVQIQHNIDTLTDILE